MAMLFGDRNMFQMWKRPWGGKLAGARLCCWLIHELRARVLEQYGCLAWPQTGIPERESNVIKKSVRLIMIGALWVTLGIQVG